MNTKERIYKALDRQASIEGETENIKMVRSFVGCIKTNSQFVAFVNVKFHRWGKSSFQSYRFYYCTEELKNIMKLKEKNNDLQR